MRRLKAYTKMPNRNARDWEWWIDREFLRARNDLFLRLLLLTNDNKRILVAKYKGVSVINNDRIPGKSRVISARSGRRANCCVAAGLLTGATEFSVRLGTIRAISPPFGASLKHSPTTFHTPLLPRCDHYRLFPLFNPQWTDKC